MTSLVVVVRFGYRASEQGLKHSAPNDDDDDERFTPFFASRIISSETACIANARVHTLLSHRASVSNGNKLGPRNGKKVCRLPPSSCVCGGWLAC